MLQMGRRQLFEISQIESVDPLHRTFLGAAQEQSVIDLCPGPARIRHSFHGFEIVVFYDSDRVEVLQKIAANDARRFQWMNTGHNWDAGKSGVDFRNRVLADEALIFAASDAGEGSGSLDEVAMRLNGGRNKDRCVEKHNHRSSPNRILHTFFANRFHYSVEIGTLLSPPHMNQQPIDLD